MAAKIKSEKNRAKIQNNEKFVEKIMVLKILIL